MVVKQRQSQKPRPPSPTLWAIVRKIGDTHWQQLRAASQAFGKKSMYFRLLEFLRAMPVYDPEAEKKEFGNSSLHTMRGQAKKWLLRTAMKLGLYLGQAEGDVVGVDVFIQWECFDDALDLIENARIIATEQGDHAKLTRLYEQEIEIARQLYIGEERIEEMSRLVLLAIENAKKHSIEAEIRNLTTYHIEINKYRFNLKGEFDLKAASSYFKSEFSKNDISNWPILLQIGKLHLDEWNYYIQLQQKKSVEVAIQILDLYDHNPEIRSAYSADHAKVLFRVCGSSADLGNVQNSEKVLRAFRDIEPLSLKNQGSYLTFFIQTLFHFGYVSHNMKVAQEGAEIWESHKAHLLSLPMDSTAITSILYVCSFYLAIADFERARVLLNILLKFEDAIQPAWAKEIFRLFHIIILIEERDEMGLGSFARRYQRELERLDANSLGLKMLKLLRRPLHIHRPKILANSLPKLIELVERHDNSNETAYKPFTFPIIRWASVALDRLK
ncbi:MAG: hypothetical protein RLZZ519_3376 [Bacteroidota bacterium]|jgi:hypothetical protein